MSSELEIVELTNKKIDVRFKERVLDPNRPVKDFDDVIELGMYGAYELNDYDDFKFLEQFKGIEMKLEENPSYTKFASTMNTLREDVMKSSGMQSMLETNRVLANDPTFKSMADGQNKLRESAFKLIQPTQDFSDAIKRITEITKEHQSIWNGQIAYHKGKIVSLEEQQKDLMQVEVAKSEMVMHTAELEKATLLVKKADTVFVSDHHKKLEKNIQQHIVRNKTKNKVPDGSGVSKKQQDMLDDIYQMWIEYSSMKKGKFLKGDLFDTRKRRYTNEECYNFIQATYPKLEIGTIEKYIKDYNQMK